MVTDNLKEAVKGADIVISVVADKIAYIKTLKAGLVTYKDRWGSVKKITDDIGGLKGYKDNFIGSHPMVGSENRVKNSILTCLTRATVLSRAPKKVNMQKKWRVLESGR